jgi:hypothetical protein
VRSPRAATVAARSLSASRVLQTATAAPRTAARYERATTVCTAAAAGCSARKTRCAATGCAAQRALGRSSSAWGSAWTRSQTRITAARAGPCAPVLPMPAASVARVVAASSATRASRTATRSRRTAARSDSGRTRTARTAATLARVTSIAA